MHVLDSCFDPPNIRLAQIEPPAPKCLFYRTTLSEENQVTGLRLWRELSLRKKRLPSNLVFPRTIQQVHGASVVGSGRIRFTSGSAMRR